VIPDDRRLAAFALTGDQIMPALSVVRREGIPMRIGFTLRDGREIPMTVKRVEPEGDAFSSLRDLRLATPAGSLTLDQLTDVRREPPQPTIRHHNGRREVSVSWRFGSKAPQTGPGRESLEREVRTALRDAHRPAGYTIEVPPPDQNTRWFKRILVPVLLLLFAVMAITFESLTLPLLVLVSLPLTMLGATWSLVFSRTPAGPMALIGVIALIGLTVNPAILLVDRMQQRARNGASPGAAALAAVRERARPVLMTTATTVAGLWPLAIVTGREDEIWPPFAIVVMGGLVTSTLLTLLAVPVGFVGLRKLDRLFGKLGPYLVLAWVGATTAVCWPIFSSGLVASMTWRIVSVVLIAAALLGIAVWVFRRPERPKPHQDEGKPPRLDVRYLKKVYGKPGPVGYAWRLPTMFARRVLARGGSPFHPVSARARIMPFLVVAVGVIWLSRVVGPFWSFVFTFVAAGLLVGAVSQFRRSRGKVDPLGRVLPGGPEGWIALALPWIAWCIWTFEVWIRPKWIAAQDPTYRAWFVILVAVGIAFVQFGRTTARRESARDTGARRGGLDREISETGRIRALWRAFSMRVFGLDLEREEVKALSHLHFEADGGMVGILGPNGAGKTTLLRQLAGILEPSRGTIHIGGVRLEKLKRQLARWIGYLPQEFGLPDDLTAREYL
ncbi:MAG: efflux RND transporter permease subunit, partial [Planctomycetota bacterium]|nr:efflux RND transporter permease subunit [Planctomycetota bacterium]